MIKNYILKVEDLIEYKIRGIISPVSMHYLAWELNKTVPLDLERSQDHRIKNKKTHSLHILYQDHHMDEHDFFLIKNKGISSVLLPGHPMLDAVLLERNYDGEFLPGFLESIQTPSMQLCLDINYKSLSDIERSNLEIN